MKIGFVRQESTVSVRERERERERAAVVEWILVVV